MAQPIILPDCAQKLLAFLYPNVDWTRVIFYSGMPFWVSSSTVGLTIPDPLSMSAFRVYLRNTDFCIDTGTESDPISALVHEAFHIQQFMGSVGGGYGSGWLRPGFFNYLVCWISCGFSTDENAGNAFEDGAYQQEHCFRACRQNQPKVCDCASGTPVFNPAGLNALGACHGKPDCKNPLIVREPRVPTGDCGPWWAVLGGYILATLIILLLVGAGTFFSLPDLLNCKYLEIRSRQCAQWGRNARRQCNQWADQGHNQCNDWRDDGYTACREYADWGYNACCNWAPCSWFCNAFVWITNIVCVLSVWVVNMVCHAVIWIVNIVCVAWVTFIEVVCLLWIFVIRTILLCWWR